MEKKMNSLSPDLKIHPGETLKEILEDREMSLKGLAFKVGLTESYISNIVNGVKPITITLAKKLEKTLGIENNFWINLQLNYDKERQQE
jgi:HTH-type transcriptional regulator/antitoxin HigA